MQKKIVVDWVPLIRDTSMWVTKKDKKWVSSRVKDMLKYAEVKVPMIEGDDEDGYSKEEKQKQLEILLNEIEERKKKYGILDTKMNRIPQQTQLLEDIRTRALHEDKPRFFLYYGGNGAGKSHSWAYITVCLALGQSTKKYWLPFLGWKKRIWILTKSGSNVRNTIEPYLLGDSSPCRIPPEMINGNPKKDNGVLKSISLVNGTEINILTYDQGSENLQGANPDWIWLDEEPVNTDVVTEIIARTRTEECEMLVTMTPLSGLTRLYEFFFNVDSANVKRKSRVYLVSSLDNPFIDKTWTEGLTEDEYRLRVLGSFESPTGLVYSSFHRTKCTVPHFDPKDMGEVKYYRGLDFGVSHPTGCVFLSVDNDDNVYVWDEVYRANTLVEDLAKEITQKTWLREIEYTVRDSASKREGIEIARYWIKTVPADKFSKGEGDVSNRKAGIMMINQMLKDWKLLISQNCKNLIREFETHYYREWGKKDWEVNKINDDLLDALRYVLWTIKKNQKKGKTIEQRNFEKAQFKQEAKGKKVNKFVKF